MQGVFEELFLSRRRPRYNQKQSSPCDEFPPLREHRRVSTLLVREAEIVRYLRICDV
jgi:hypothetical protein